MIIGMVEVGHQSAWFSTDSACGGVAIGLGPWSWHWMWSHLVSHGFSRGFNHYDSTIRGTEGAELGQPTSASGGSHPAEV